MARTTLTSEQIRDNSIINVDISPSAAIDYSKLAPMLSGSILLGNASNVATSTVISGDIGIASNGVASISSGVIVNNDVNASAAIDGTKISPNFGAQNVVTTGRIGAGTSSPAQQLHVQGSSGDLALFQATSGSNQDAYISLRPDGTAVYSQIKFYSADGLLSSGILNYAGSNLYIDTAANGTLAFRTPGSGYSWWQTGSSEKMRLTNDGYLGIGTTTPLHKLEVVSDNSDYRLILDTSYATSNTQSPGFRTRRAGGTLASPAACAQNDQIGTFQAAGYANGAFTGGRVAMHMFASEAWTASAQGSYITFITTPSGAITQSERMRVTSGGSVAIGTGGNPSSSAILEVASTTAGFLPPRMTTTQRTAISTPAAGLLVYDTDLSQFMGYNGSAWVILG